MSATGLEVFDKTLQSTNIWLDQIMRAIGPDRHVAWHALGAVLRCLRDRVPLGLAANLGSQLPILIRGAYYDQWNPDAPPSTARSADEFLEEVSRGLGGTRPVNVRDTVRAVLGTINTHVAEGQVRKVRESLPEDVRRLWPEGSGPAAEPEETPHVRKHRPRPAQRQERGARTGTARKRA